MGGGCWRRVAWSAAVLALLAGLLGPDWGVQAAVAEEVEEVEVDDEGDDMPFDLPEGLMMGNQDEEEPSDDEDTSMPPSLEQTTETVTVPPVAYTKPSTAGLHFAELFEDDWTDRWIVSNIEKFSGRWERALRAVEAITGDYGLRVMDKAKHHAAAAKFPKITTTKGKGLVVSYEAKFEEGLSCGGAYLKIFDSNGMDLGKFDNETPYAIMFGPDRCGSTNKVHVIIRAKNPVSGAWGEHHLKTPPNVPSGSDSHVYSLNIQPDDDYEVFVDNKSVAKGSMHTDFDPPFTPSKEIDDPEDSKPADWVDEPKMDDPDAKKPEDWDEDAPKLIPDPDAHMPEGWLEDEPGEIVDPDASKPEDWNDEEDGEWTAPTIPNPKCSVGCGEWSAPQIQNPQYKGPWSAPLINNPDYKGVWAPKKIANPNFYEHEHPHELSGSAIDAVGFELWTMDAGLLFDNIVVAHSWDATKQFIDVTFKVRHEIESSRSSAAKAQDLQSPEDGALGRIVQFAVQNPLLSATTSSVFLIALIFVVFRSFGRKDSSKPAKEGEKSKAKAKDSSDEETEEPAKADKATKENESPKARKRGGRPAPAD